MEVAAPPIGRDPWTASCESYTVSNRKDTLRKTSRDKRETIQGEVFKNHKQVFTGGSVVKICLPIWGTQVQPLVREVSTCPGAHAPHLESSLSAATREGPHAAPETQHSQK